MCKWTTLDPNQLIWNTGQWVWNDEHWKFFFSGFFSESNHNSILWLHTWIGKGGSKKFLWISDSSANFSIASCPCLDINRLCRLEQFAAITGRPFILQKSIKGLYARWFSGGSSQWLIKVSYSIKFKRYSSNKACADLSKNRDRYFSKSQNMHFGIVSKN